MFSVITNIYNKKTKGPTVMELFTATGKLKKFFWQLEMFDVCTTGDTAHIDTYSSSCHTHVNMGVSIFFTAAMIRAFRSARSRGSGGTYTGKRNRDCAACRKNAVNLVVASINEIGFWDPALSVSGWNARVLRVKKLQPINVLQQFYDICKYLNFFYKARNMNYFFKNQKSR
jgi:hypothetical protein